MKKKIEEYEVIIYSILDLIPTVSLRKIEKKIRGQLEIREQQIIHEISFDEIVNRINSLFPNLSNLENIVSALLITLNSIGIISIREELGLTKISATSYSSSSLLQNISFHLKNSNGKISPIKQNSSIRFFQSTIEDQISDEKIDPHLLLSNIFSQQFYDWQLQPNLKSRVISVLIKGKRYKNKKLRNEYDEVYLHVYKPEWGKYALIGSNQQEGWNDETTAKIALDEDLETRSGSFILKSSGVNDFILSEPEIKLGLFTRFEFNLFYVTEIKGELKFRSDLKYAWFTKEEIMKRRSENNDNLIMTRHELLEKIDNTYKLSSIPITVGNINLLNYDDTYYHVKKMQYYFNNGVKEIFFIGKKFLRLILKIWWIISIIIILIVLLFLIFPFHWDKLERTDIIISLLVSILTIGYFLIKQINKHNKNK
ncbi:MAG: hypothetical protein Q7U53_13870 [Anaerolineaceae bacterium]|nr:hypothetical protein [Anaerolineaceae bacterium]